MEMHKRGTILAVTVFLLIAAVAAQLSFKGGHCPLKETVMRCTPRCISDFECSMNKKCCPNRCGSTSCVETSAVNTGSSYKGSHNDGVYCGGVKCGPYEKCQFDRKTKRDKCVRT